MTLPAERRPPRPGTTGSGLAPDSPPRSSRGSVAVGAIVALAVLAVSAALVFWARTRPGFDPYGWLVWGYQTIHGSLDTNAAPSWKPLPFLFTTPYALVAGAQVRLWMITAAAVSLSGPVFAARIAFRLTAAPDGRRWAAWVAGAFAGLALLGIQSYFHYILSAQSDPMIVALCLGAIDMHLSGRPRVALLLGALAGLGRPEVWPFLGLYWLWLWRTLPSARWLLAGVLVAMALLWFGIPALTSRTPFVAASNALDSGRRLTSDQVGGTIHRFLDLHHWSLELAAALALALAAWRRNRQDWVTLVLGAGVVAWVAVEIAFALHGWPGLARYMFEAAGVMVVLAGVGVGRLLADPPRLGGLGTIAGALLAAALVVSLIPASASGIRIERHDITQQRLRTDQINRLDALVARLGGSARLLACGAPMTSLEYQSVLARTLGVNVGKIGYKLHRAIAHHRVIVAYVPQVTGTGWTIRGFHQRGAACPTLYAVG